MTFMKIKFPQPKKGFTLIELVIYVAGLLILISVMILLIVQFYVLYREIIAVPRADRAGLTIVDRITKEIRAGDSIDLLNSQFNNTNGVLEFDSVESGTVISKSFYLENGKAMYSRGLESPVSLTSRDLYVSNFYFTLVPTDVSTGIKFDLEIQFLTQNGTETKAYTGFSILRESYE